MGKREQPAFRCALHVLKDVNLEVAEGEKLVIIGPSGSGKSTTVRCMNFLEEPTSGHVYIDGQELTAKNKTKLVRETTSALDPETIQEVLDVMVRLAHEKTSPWWWSPTRWVLPGRWQTVWCLWQTARSWKKAHRSTSSPILKTSVCASSWARSSGKQFWSLRSCRSTSGTRCG